MGFATELGAGNWAGAAPRQGGGVHSGRNHFLPELLGRNPRGNKIIKTKAMVENGEVLRKRK